MGREQGILDGGLSGDLPRVEMAEYEPHVMRAGGGGKLGVRLSADRFRFLKVIVIFVGSIAGRAHPPRDSGAILVLLCDYLFFTVTAWRCC